MDCAYKILHRNKYGYVIKCHECGHIEMAFGTTALMLTYDRFSEFTETLREYYEAYRHTAVVHQKVIRIPTPLHSIRLVYSLRELKRLLYLLEMAHATLAIENLLNAELS